MVGVTGFEPAAPWSQTKCATGLRYTPTKIVFHVKLRCRLPPSAEFRGTFTAPIQGAALRAAAQCSPAIRGLRVVPNHDCYRAALHPDE